MSFKKDVKVLVLDPEDFHRQTICALLKLQGFEALGLGDASELENRLREFIPTVVLLDLDYPFPNLKALIQIFKKTSIPVIALTHVKDEKKLKEALQAGVRDVISKDHFQMEKFVQSLKDAIESASKKRTKATKSTRQTPKKEEPPIQKPSSTQGKTVESPMAKESAEVSQKIDEQTIQPSSLPQHIRQIISKEELLESIQNKLLKRKLNKKLMTFFELLSITGKGNVRSLNEFLLGRDTLVDKLKFAAKQLGLESGVETLTVLKELGFPFSGELSCYFYLMDSFPCDQSPISRLLFWSHTVSVATLSKHLAQAADFEKSQLLMSIAMLHNLGRAYLISFEPEVIGEIDRLQKDYPGVSIREIEKRILPVGHDEIGAHLLQHSIYPEEIYQVIRYHHAQASMLKNHSEIDLKLLKILQGSIEILETRNLNEMVLRKGSPVLETLMKITRRNDERFAHRVFVDAKHECLRVLFLILKDEENFSTQSR